MLSGSLDTFPAGDILGLVTRSRHPGVLRVRGPRDGAVYCRDGAVTFATVDDSVGVGDVLVRAGFLSAGDWEAVVSGGDARQRLNELLARGNADLTRIHSCVRLQTEESLFELDRWAQGDFRFEPEVDHPLGDTFRYPTDALVRAIAARRRAWARIMRRIPSLDAIVDQTPAPPGDGDVTVSKNQWRLLVAVDGSKTVHQLADEIHESAFSTCETLLGMLDAGLVVLRPPRRAGAAEAAPEPFEPAAERVAGPGSAGPSLAAILSNGAAEPAVSGNGAGAGAGSNGHAEPALPPVAPWFESRAPAGAAQAPVAHDPAVDGLRPGGVRFVAGGDRPARDLILRLLSAVKEL